MLATELKSEVLKEVSKPFKEIDTNRLAELYESVFYIPLDLCCPRCIKTGVKNLKIWTETNKTNHVMKNENKFKIKEKYLPNDGQMRVKGYHKIITQENFTNADAEFLKKNGMGEMLEEVGEVKAEEKDSKKK